MGGSLPGDVCLPGAFYRALKKTTSKRRMSPDNDKCYEENKTTRWQGDLRTDSLLLWEPHSLSPEAGRATLKA